MNKHSSRPTSSGRPPTRTVASGDGSVTYTLTRTSSGLLVERVQQRFGGARIVQTALFTDAEVFHRWCAADSIRFDHPLVYANLRRAGDALFRSAA